MTGCWDAHACSLLQVAAYEFTTLTCIPGVVRYRGAKIQLLDLPGIIEGAKDGKGRGRQVCPHLILVVPDKHHASLCCKAFKGYGGVAQARGTPCSWLLANRACTGCLMHAAAWPHDRTSKCWLRQMVLCMHLLLHKPSGIV